MTTLHSAVAVTKAARKRRRRASFEDAICVDVVNAIYGRDNFEPRMFAVLRVAAGEKIDAVALDTRIARRELQAYVQEFRRRGAVSSGKR